MRPARPVEQLWPNIVSYDSRILMNVGPSDKIKPCKEDHVSACPEMSVVFSRTSHEGTRIVPRALRFWGSEDHVAWFPTLLFSELPIGARCVVLTYQDEYCGIAHDSELRAVNVTVDISIHEGFCLDGSSCSLLFENRFRSLSPVMFNDTRYPERQDPLFAGSGSDDGYDSPLGAV